MDREDMEKLESLTGILNQAIDSSLANNLNVLDMLNKFQELGYEASVTIVVVRKNKGCTLENVQPKVVDGKVASNAFTPDDISLFKEVFHIEL